MKDFLAIVGMILATAALLVFMFALVPFLFMLAWDYTMPSLFNLPEIKFWQSFALIFLCGLLFRSRS